MYIKYALLQDFQIWTEYWVFLETKEDAEATNVFIELSDVSTLHDEDSRIEGQCFIENLSGKQLSALVQAYVRQLIEKLLKLNPYP